MMRTTMRTLALAALAVALVGLTADVAAPAAWRRCVRYRGGGAGRGGLCGGGAVAATAATVAAMAMVAVFTWVLEALTMQGLLRVVTGQPYYYRYAAAITIRDDIYPDTAS